MNDDSDWDQCTASGLPLAELRVWMRLPLRKKLQAAEDLADLATRLFDARRRSRLPYIDPATGKAIGRG